MATSFEDFIQLELPKRPFLEQDVPQESVIIRRGQGARQLGGVSLEDGQILVKRNGLLVAEALSAAASASVDSICHVQSAAAIKWTITHSKNNRNVIITLYDSSYKAILADNMIVTTSTITIDFLEAQAGIANVIFLPN